MRYQAVDIALVDKFCMLFSAHVVDEVVKHYLKEIATFLCVSVSDLIGDDSNLNNEVNNIYFSFAKKAQDNGIDPNDIEMAIAMILKLKDKGNKEE